MADKTFTNEPGANYEQDKAAEEISNAARDKVVIIDQILVSEFTISPIM